MQIQTDIRTVICDLYMQKFAPKWTPLPQLSISQRYTQKNRGNADKTSSPEAKFYSLYAVQGEN